MLIPWLALGCASSAQPSHATSRPSVTQPGPAYELAESVRDAAGAADLERVAQIDFSFVVIAGEERVFVADHRWDLRGRRARISWSKEGKSYDALLNIEEKTATGTIDGEPATDQAAVELSKQAYGRYINDTYWLMLPLKLFDEGTKLERLPSRDIDGETHEVLKLSFQGVGLTPGDVYWLFINPESSRIVRWEMKLEGQENAPPRGVSWTDYRPVGPLLLAHDHVMDGTDRHVVFEGTRAGQTVNERDFILGL